MSQNEAPDINADFLPVGMISGGGTYALAIEQAAMRKHAVPGWAPFHYEKISASEYECNGGFSIGSGGYKKWPEPHTSVIITEAEIQHELQLLLADDAVNSEESNAATPLQTRTTQHSPNAPKFLTVVLQLPDDLLGQQRIKNAFHLDANFFGAVVTSVSSRLPT